MSRGAALDNLQGPLQLQYCYTVENKWRKPPFFYKSAGSSPFESNAFFLIKLLCFYKSFRNRRCLFLRSWMTKLIPNLSVCRNSKRTSLPRIWRSYTLESFANTVFADVSLKGVLFTASRASFISRWAMTRSTPPFTQRGPSWLVLIWTRSASLSSCDVETRKPLVDGLVHCAKLGNESSDSTDWFYAEYVVGLQEEELPFLAKLKC